MTQLYQHREGITYLEHCRVMVDNERLTLVRRKDAFDFHWSIPFASLAVLLLGPGTSLTQQAARLLASEGVLVGYTGGGGTPLHFAAQNEYREPGYCQAWAKKWFDEAWRLKAAKYLQEQRTEVIEEGWLRLFGKEIDVSGHLARYRDKMAKIGDIPQLLAAEGELTKRLYKELATQVLQGEFQRQPQQKQDLANRFLDQGNYLAYGLAGLVLWALGIPHSFPLVHGKTRRGGLVFDLADVIKDGCIMPVAFICAAQERTESEFRQMALRQLKEEQALETLFEVMKTLCEEVLA